MSELEIETRLLICCFIVIGLCFTAVFWPVHQTMLAIAAFIILVSIVAVRFFLYWTEDAVIKSKIRDLGDSSEG